MQTGREREREFKFVPCSTWIPAEVQTKRIRVKVYVCKKSSRVRMQLISPGGVFWIHFY